jgi:hypothetical protein
LSHATGIVKIVSRILRLIKIVLSEHGRMAVNQKDDGVFLISVFFDFLLVHAAKHEQVLTTGGIRVILTEIPGSTFCTTEYYVFEIHFY